MDRSVEQRSGAALARARPATGWARPAIFGVLLTIASAVSMMAVAIRPFSSADEIYHMDYAYQVWNGHLPVFEKGLAWHPTGVWNVQLEAQHPPLYYAILAPLVGPLADGGHWVAATVAARMVSALLTIAAIAAVAWAGSLLSRTRRWEYAIVTAAVASSLTLLVHVGGSVYNDSLATLVTILGLGVALYTIRSGVTGRALIALALVGAAGGLSRGQFVVSSLVIGGGVGLAVLLHTTGPRLTRLAKAAAIGLIPVLGVLAAAGWFYWRNIRLTGSWTGGHEAWGVAHLHRVLRPVSDVVTWPAFWGKQWQLLHESSDTHNVGQWLVALLAAIAVIGYLVRARRPRSRRRSIDRQQAAIVLVLGIQAAVVLISEIRYVAHAGGNNLRYQLPALLPVAALLAAGFLALPRRVVPVAFLAYLSVAWTYFALWILDGHPAGTRIWSGRTPTGAPWALILVGVVGIAAGTGLQILGLVRYQRCGTSAPGPLPAQLSDTTPVGFGARHAAATSRDRGLTASAAGVGDMTHEAALPHHDR